MEVVEAEDTEEVEVDTEEVEEVEDMVEVAMDTEEVEDGDTEDTEVAMDMAVEHSTAAAVAVGVGEIGAGVTDTGGLSIIL